MGNLNHVGLFCCLLFVEVGVRLSLGDENVSDSFLQVLMRKFHEQDEKISAIEANTKLDHKELVGKVLRLEEMLKYSDYKQKTKNDRKYGQNYQRTRNQNTHQKFE